MSAGRRRPVHVSVLTHAFLVLVSLATIYPILQIVTVSLRPTDSLYSTSLALIPEHATLHAYYAILFEKQFLVWMRNSALVSFAVTVFGVALASTAAYAFSRFRFPGWRLGLYSFLLTQLFPATMLMLPLYVLMKALHLLDTFAGLTIAYTATALPFCVWTMRGYYDTIPKAIDESAIIDGCTRGQILRRILLPLSMPGNVATLIFCFWRT